jgi:2-polyprenyl-6-methoxyphenol hydroxylase-like FAD-dependent oxidoreductase
MVRHGPTMSTESGIVVVGAGPTGLTLACELHSRGIPCRTIAEAGGPTTVTRALGMFTRSLEVLEDFGAAEEAIARGQRLEIVNIYGDRRRIGGFHAASLTGTRHPVILALPQSETELLLEERLELLGGSVERETTLRELRQSPGDTTVRLALSTPHGDETVEARWVVGADGAHSTVRKSLGIEFAGEATRDVFVIVDAMLDDGPATGEVHYYFSRDGIMVISPLPDGSYRIAAGMSGFIGDGSPVSASAVQEILDRRVGRGTRLRELRDAGWGAAQVRPHTRLADRFRSGRCLLAGDAGHVYSPIGGQGMNGGIQDAHNLAWKLGLVATNKASESLLDSYAHERRAVAQRSLRLTATQMRMGRMRSRVGLALRNGLVTGMSRAGMLDRYMAPESVMLKISYSENPGVSAGGWRGRQGDRIPDLPLTGDGKDSQTLFDVIRGHPLTVLALAVKQEDSGRVDELAKRAFVRYDGLVPIHKVAIVKDSHAAAPSAPLIDCGGRLHRHLRAKEASLCLVRADGHIAYFDSLTASASLFAYLDAVLHVNDSSSVNDSPVAGKAT